MNTLLRSVSILALAAAALAASAQANLVKNPGFETGSFTGWTTSGTQSVLTNMPHSGTYSAATNQSTDDPLVSLSQSIATVPGASYTVSYYFSGQMTVGSVNHIDATFGSGSLATNNVNSPYALLSFTGVASGTTTPLTFHYSAEGNGASGSYLDDVSVVANAPSTTPEPGTWAALGLGSLAALRRRRRA